MPDVRVQFHEIVFAVVKPQVVQLSDKLKIQKNVTSIFCFISNETKKIRKNIYHQVKDGGFLGNVSAEPTLQMRNVGPIGVCRPIVPGGEILNTFLRNSSLSVALACAGKRSIFIPNNLDAFISGLVGPPLKCHRKEIKEKEMPPIE